MTSSSQHNSHFELHPQESPEEDRAEARSVVVRSLEEAGLREQPPEEILDRLVLLELHTKFNQHGRAVEQGVRAVLTYLKEHNEENKPIFNIDEDAIRDACIASVLHDIGKTGPPDATPAEQRVTVDLFSYPVEEIGAPHHVTIEKAFTVNGVSPQGEGIQSTLKESGLTFLNTMRDFYNRHAPWGEEVLRKHTDVFGDRIRLFVASHHLDRGIDPRGIFPKLIVEGVLKEKDALGVEGRVLIAMDKYEAAVTRRGIAHAEAMVVVKEMVRARFGQDPLMEAILKALDECGAKGEIFR